jgi:hypothetical protein
MAKYNEILVGRLNRFLQKYTAIKGTVPAPQLAGEITPSLPLFSGEENRYLENWNLFGNGSTQAGAVAQNSAWRFRNPVGTNVIAVIYQLIATGDTLGTMAFTLDTTSTDLANPGAVHSLDGRTLTAGSVVFISSGNNDVAAHPVITRWVSLINTSFFVLAAGVEIPVLPGTTVEIVTAATNVVLTMGCFWRERFLEDSERT